MVAGFLIGSLFWFVVACWFNLKHIAPTIKAKKYASARFDKAKNRWQIVGDLNAVIEQVNKAQHERPGSVKYVD